MILFLVGLAGLVGQGNSVSTSIVKAAFIWILTFAIGAIVLVLAAVVFLALFQLGIIG